MKDNREMIKINSLSGIKRVGNKPFKVVIDTYRSHISDGEAIKFLEKLGAGGIIVLTPYHTSKPKAKTPTYFISRRESTKNLLEITYSRHLPHRDSQLYFSHNRSKIMRLILKNKNEGSITSTPNILQQTLKIQKFSIMYKLKLRRMSDIVTLGIISCF